MLQSRKHLIFSEGSESEPGASGLEGGNDFGKVIADETESSVFCVFFDDPSKSILGVGRHRISLV